MDDENVRGCGTTEDSPQANAVALAKRGRFASGKTNRYRRREKIRVRNEKLFNETADLGRRSREAYDVRIGGYAGYDIEALREACEECRLGGRGTYINADNKFTSGHVCVASLIRTVRCG